MRKNIFAISAAAVLAVASVQFAAAAEGKQARKVHRAPITTEQQARGANAFWANQQESPASYGGGWSAPAGR